jgi:hypothetical protein
VKRLKLIVKSDTISWTLFRAGSVSTNQMTELNSGEKKLERSQLTIGTVELLIKQLKFLSDLIREQKIPVDAAMFDELVRVLGQHLYGILVTTQVV